MYDSVWTDDTIRRLRELWLEGLSTSEIGRRLGLSKNAVVGKVHRLDLPARNSPIKRDGQRSAQPRIRRNSSRTTLPALRCLQQPLTATAPSARDRPTVRRAPAVPPAHLHPWKKSQPCCWPIGEPGTSGFRYCERDSLPGKSYCAEHFRRAYVSTWNYVEQTSREATTDE